MSSIENQHGRQERTKFFFISFPELAGGKNLQAVYKSAVFDFHVG
jgi:hypothetical protein